MEPSSENESTRKLTHLTRDLNRGLVRHCTMSMCNGGCGVVSGIGTGLRRGGAIVATSRRSSTIRHARLAVSLLRSLSMHILRVLAVHWCALCRVGLSTVVVGVVVLATSGLRNIRLDRHTARHYVRCSSATSSILGRCWSAETLRQLLHESLCDIVDGNVHSIGDTQHNKGAFA